MYTHEVRGHMLYKIRASKQIQLKRDGKMFLHLHDVSIELYAEDGSRVDRIEGDEFEYDPGEGIAKALGPVEITSDEAVTWHQLSRRMPPQTKAISSKQNTGSLASAAETAARGRDPCKTSGLILTAKAARLRRKRRVEFSLAQGTGSAIGAKYDAHDGLLVLDHAVQLNVERGADPVRCYPRSMRSFSVMIRRVNCRLRRCSIGTMYLSAATAKVYFRDDGSAERLDATRGFLADYSHRADESLRQLQR